MCRGPTGRRAIASGLIGTGWYGKSDLWRLIQVAPVEVVSLCDVDRHQLAGAAEMAATRQKSGKTPRTYTDYREMLKEKDLDIVLIGTPDHWHALQMIAAVESGVDVYCQKPISRDVLEGEAMVAAARKHGRVVQVGTQRKSTPHLIEAKKNVVAAGLLGKVASRGDLLLLSHAGERQPAASPPCPTISTTKRGPALRRCGLTMACRTCAGGGPSWNTATASSATCAFTCWTRRAGCSAWVGPRRSGPVAAYLSTRRQIEHQRHANGQLRYLTASPSLGSIAVGAHRRMRSIPGR